MSSFSNDCGARNNFGFYDFRANEIYLTRPCTIRADIKEAYTWFDSLPNLKKLTIGIGAVEQTVVNANNSLYSVARATIYKDVIQNTTLDAEVLKNILAHLKNKNKLRTLNLRCYIFSEDAELFNMLLNTIQQLPSLVHLDLTGCYFSNDQLIGLARAISESHIASLIWPEPRMPQLILDQVTRALSSCHSITKIEGAPSEIEQIVAANRKWVYTNLSKPESLTDKEREIIREYRESFRIAIAHQREYMLNLEKTLEGILI